MLCIFSFNYVPAGTLAVWVAAASPAQSVRPAAALPAPVRDMTQRGAPVRRGPCTWAGFAIDARLVPNCLPKRPFPACYIAHQLAQRPSTARRRQRGPAQRRRLPTPPEQNDTQPPAGQPANTCILQHGRSAIPHPLPGPPPSTRPNRPPGSNALEQREQAAVAPRVLFQNTTATPPCAAPGVDRGLLSPINAGGGQRRAERPQHARAHMRGGRGRGRWLLAGCG